MIAYVLKVHGIFLMTVNAAYMKGLEATEMSFYNDYRLYMVAAFHYVTKMQYTHGRIAEWL